MYVPVTRTPSEYHPARRNLTRSQRALLVSPLVALKGQQDGHLYSWQINGVARQHGRDPRSIRRDLAELDQPDRTRVPAAAPRELLVRAAMYDGNIRRAHNELIEEQERGEADYALKSYWTSYRAIHRDPGLQIALVKGVEKLQEFLMVGEYVPTYRNEVCYVDAYKIPVLCVDQYGKLIEDLWLLSVFEAYARLVSAHTICVGEVTGQLTADTILAAAMGRWLSVDELASHGIENSLPILVGGPGDVTVVDNAKANAAELVRTTAEFVGTKLIFGRPHIAVDKAPQERWHWTLELDLQALPGYTNGAERHPADGHPSRPYAVPPRHQLPRVEAVIAAVNAMIDQYNWSHVLSTTQSAPIPRFLAEPTKLRPVDPELAWERMAPLAPHLVHPRGVKVPGPEFLTVTHRDFVPGRTVELRTLHGAPGRTFFGVDGRYRAEVKRHPALSEDEVKARGVQNAIRGRTARSVLKEAGERLVTEGLPEVHGIPELAFDHAEIIQKGLEHLRKKLQNEPIGFELLPDKFTIRELQSLYEVILGCVLDNRNFRKKILKSSYLIQLNEKQLGVPHKPAHFYQFDRSRYEKHYKEHIGFNF